MDAGFVVGSIAGAVLDPAPEVVLALHACDTATDEALARAVEWGAQLVLAAPCCHHDIAAQLRRTPTPAPYAMLTRHGILRERLADTLTDGLRASLMRLQGYRVDVMQFVESKHTPRNTMLRAVRTGGAGQGWRRAQGVRRAWSPSGGSGRGSPSCWPSFRDAAGPGGHPRRGGGPLRDRHGRRRRGRDGGGVPVPGPADRRVERAGRPDGLFVTVNDSGDSGRVFVVDGGTGRTVGGATWSTEPEDIEALAPLPGGAVWSATSGTTTASASR